MTAQLKTAMLIDDRAVNHIAFERFVDRSGLIDNLFSFESAREALEFLRRPDCPGIDIIFLETILPGVSGLSFLELARAEHGPSFEDAFVVVLTTSRDLGDRAKAEAHPAVKAYFNKPLSYEHIAEILARRDGTAETGPTPPPLHPGVPTPPLRL